MYVATYSNIKISVHLTINQTILNGNARNHRIHSEISNCRKDLRFQNTGNGGPMNSGFSSTFASSEEGVANLFKNVVALDLLLFTRVFLF
jgi:hypothetical protein